MLIAGLSTQSFLIVLCLYFLAHNSSFQRYLAAQLASKEAPVRGGIQSYFNYSRLQQGRVGGIFPATAAVVVLPPKPIQSTFAADYLPGISLVKEATLFPRLLAVVSIRYWMISI